MATNLANSIQIITKQPCVQIKFTKTTILPSDAELVTSPAGLH